MKSFMLLPCVAAFITVTLMLTPTFGQSRPSPVKLRVEITKLSVLEEDDNHISLGLSLKLNFLNVNEKNLFLWKRDIHLVSVVLAGSEQDLLDKNYVYSQRT